jgi:hypothetical protein
MSKSSLDVIFTLDCLFVLLEAGFIVSWFSASKNRREQSQLAAQQFLRDYTAAVSYYHMNPPTTQHSSTTVKPTG